GNRREGIEFAGRGGSPDCCRVIAKRKCPKFGGSLSTRLEEQRTMGSRREFITKTSGAMAGAGLMVAQAQVPAAAQQPEGRSKLDEVRARGKLIVGVTSEAPPFGFIDDKGELTGFDIEVAKLFAKAMFGD